MENDGLIFAARDKDIWTEIFVKRNHAHALLVLIGYIGAFLCGQVHDLDDTIVERVSQTAAINRVLHTGDVFESLNVAIHTVVFGGVAIYSVLQSQSNDVLLAPTKNGVIKIIREVRSIEDLERQGFLLFDGTNGLLRGWLLWRTQ